MAALLVSFARDGKPTSARVPSWPKFTAAKPRVVALGAAIEIVDWPNYEALPLLASPAVSPPRGAPGGRPRD